MRVFDLVPHRRKPYLLKGRFSQFDSAVFKISKNKSFQQAVTLSFVLSKGTVLLTHEGSAKALLTLKCGVMVFLSYVTGLFELINGGKFCFDGKTPCFPQEDAIRKDFIVFIGCYFRYFSNL